MYSVDTNPAACIKSREVCEPFSDSVQVIEGNSISFLNTFNDGLIDLLYLDSLDFDENNPGYSQEHYKNEVIAAYDKLHRNSIVMIDIVNLRMAESANWSENFYYLKDGPFIFQVIRKFLFIVTSLIDFIISYVFSLNIDDFSYVTA